MPRLTQTEYTAYLARHATQDVAEVNGCEVESNLHAQIADECKRRGWVVLHGRTDWRTGRTIGEPDFVILADNGRVIFVEAKTRTGKLSPEQAALHAWAEKLGHCVYVVRSFDDFMSILRDLNISK